MIKTIPHIILSLMFFVLTVGISINKHYSNGELYSQSFFGEAEVCGMDDNEACEMQDIPEACKTHKVFSDETKSQSSCSCEDTSEYLQFDVDYVISEKLTINTTFEKEISIIYSFLIENSIQLSLYNSFQKRNFGNCQPKNLNKTSFFQVFRC